MKKQVSNAQQPQVIGEVVKEVVKRARKSRKAKSEAQPEVQQPAAPVEEAEQAQPDTKKKKLVDFRISKSVLQNETEKAILLIVHAGEEAIKMWLPKSQVNVITDADDTESLIVRVAGWLWFRQELGKLFKAERWATEAV